MVSQRPPPAPGAAPGDGSSPHLPAPSTPPSGPPLRLGAAAPHAALANLITGPGRKNGTGGGFKRHPDASLGGRFMTGGSGRSRPGPVPLGRRSGDGRVAAGSHVPLCPPPASHGVPGRVLHLAAVAGSRPSSDTGSFVARSPADTATERPSPQLGPSRADHGWLRDLAGRQPSRGDLTGPSTEVMPAL